MPVATGVQFPPERRVGVGAPKKGTAPPAGPGKVTLSFDGLTSRGSQRVSSNAPQDRALKMPVVEPVEP